MQLWGPKSSVSERTDYLEFAVIEPKRRTSAHIKNIVDGFATENVSTILEQLIHQRKCFKGQCESHTHELW